MRKLSWWTGPRAITQEVRHRRISWLELLSDLVYVIIIHQLTTGVIDDLSWSRLGIFILLFLVFFRNWVSMVQYFDRHGDESLRTMTFTLLHIIAITVVAIYIPDVYAGHLTPFLGAYLVNQGLLTYIWLSTGIYDVGHRPAAFTYNIAHDVGLVVIVAGLLMPSLQGQITSLVVWVMIDMVTDLLMIPIEDREHRIRHLDYAISSSLIERYGQFTMIILGEALATLVELSHEHLTWAFLLSLLDIICIWGIYYTSMDNLNIQIRRYADTLKYAYFNLLIIMSLFLHVLFVSRLLEANTSLNRLGLVVSILMLVGLLYGFNLFLNHNFSRDLQRVFGWTDAAATLLVIGWLVVNPHWFQPLIIMTLFVLTITKLMWQERRRELPTE
ncbi:low temperature requirement protein A [Lacticaseibacillus saniviri]